MLSPFAIGNVQLASGLILAPMSGLTDAPFRQAVLRRSRGALGLVVSEFISVEGLTRNNLRTHQMLRYAEEERPISIQIFGGEVERIVAAAEIVQERGADILDINCGCPVPRVVRRGGGAELMRRPERLEEILRRTRAAVDIPLTLKIRAGWDRNSRNALEIAQMAEACGVTMLAIHGRTRTEAYSGEADWDLIDEVARNISIPVVGSGDIRSPLDGVRRLRETAVSGVMIGRGAMSNPWIFRCIAEALRGEQVYEPSVEEKVDFLRDYACGLGKHLPAKAVAGRVKRIATKLTRGLPGGATLRAAIYATATEQDVLRTLLQYDLNQKGRTQEAA